MSPVRVTMIRTVGLARSLPSMALAVGGFLAAVGALLSFNIEASEGGRASLAAIWALSVAPALPALASLLAMDVWSDERLSGRIDFLLTAPVRERDLVMGKFAGVFMMTMLSVLLSLASSLLLLRVFAPQAFAGVSATDFLPGLFALALQGALWCAVSMAASVFFRHAAVAACLSLALLVALPRALWAALLAWAPQGSSAFGVMPLDAHVFDISSGLLSTGVLVSYSVLAVAMLFLCSKGVAFLRLVGHGAVKLRLSTLTAIVLSFVLALLVIALALRLDTVLELPFGMEKSRLSPRTCSILAEAQGEISVTCFQSRGDADFRSVDHALRAFRREAASQGGVDIRIRYVDPRWDFAAAQKLVAAGVAVDSVVLEKGRRRVVLESAKEKLDERVFASAILRLTMPPQRSNVYWTCGHGEASFEDYGDAFGMSDIARELSRDGFRNRRLDLAADEQISSDCALVVVAGAREAFSRAEIDRLDSYLKQGGRLLLLLNAAGDSGLASMLSSWGVRVAGDSPAGARTLTGSDVVASDFASHAITAPLSGTQVVLERPVTFEASAAATGTSMDGIEFSPLVSAGGKCIAAVVERGNGAKADLALRPTRMVVVGDCLFAMNGLLSSRANANRDFFLNCVAYLAGTGALTSGGTEAGGLATGMDRRARMDFVLYSACVVPGAVFLVLAMCAVSRRRRG